jgi:hypothetical protein
MRPFDVIDFVDEYSPDDKFTNLERVIDDKLQLEFIPYSSPTFDGRGLTESVLRPHYERIMRVITARPRQYVIFCGAVFEPLVREYIVAEHRFQLPRKDGQPEKMPSQFSTLSLDYEGRRVKAGFARSWARQGIPMPAYAREVRKRYDEDRS